MAVWQCGSCMRDNGKVPFPYRHWNLLPISNISILMNATQLCCVLPVLGWRKTIKSNRAEKEQFENNFSNFERRKRNLNSISPVSRREREIRQNIINFREEKGIFFAQAQLSSENIFMVPWFPFNLYFRNNIKAHISKYFCQTGLIKTEYKSQTKMHYGLSSM